MSATQDIRVWAKDQGLDVNPKGPIPKKVMDQWHARQDEAAADAGPADEITGEVTPEGDTPEHRPNTGGSWWERRKKDKKDKPAAPRRVSIENLVSSAWGFGAMMLSREPRALPVARCLDMQAPVAGIIVNDAAKGTILDRALQPLARAGEQGAMISGLIGPPLIVGAITYNPQLYPVLRGPLKITMMQWLEVSAPAMKKAQDRAKRFEEKFGGVDLDAMIDALFAPPEGYVPPPPEEADGATQNGQAAGARQAGG